MGFKAYNNNPKLSCHDTSISLFYPKHGVCSFSYSIKYLPHSE